MQHKNTGTCSIPTHKHIQNTNAHIICSNTYTHMQQTNKRMQQHTHTCSTYNNCSSCSPSCSTMLQCCTQPWKVRLTRSKLHLQPTIETNKQGMVWWVSNSLKIFPRFLFMILKILIIMKIKISNTVARSCVSNRLQLVLKILEKLSDHPVNLSADRTQYFLCKNSCLVQFCACYILDSTPRNIQILNSAISHLFPPVFSFVQLCLLLCLRMFWDVSKSWPGTGSAHARSSLLLQTAHAHN